MALVVSPILIRRLGDEAYGLWALVFSVTEYYARLDVGIRSAVVKFVAHHWALGEDEELNRTLNTAFLFLLSLSIGLVLLTVVLAPGAPWLFTVSPEMHDTFVYMVLIAGCGWAVSHVFVCFSSCLEAVQRFDISHRILIVTNMIRVISVLGLLYFGFGLPVLLTATVGTRLIQNFLLWRAFRLHFPQFRWSLAAADRATLRKLFDFGKHTVPATIGTLLLFQGPELIIGHLLPVRFVGYYSLPRKLIVSVLELVQRIGTVTTARAAELAAQGRRQDLVRLGIQSNRYGLVVFVPAAVFLLVFGDAVFRLWLTPEFATMSAPLLPLFLVGALFADASQFSSSSMLFGLARHQVFSLALLTEAVITVGLVYWFAGQGNLWGAAAASVGVMVLNRGCLTPYLLCHHLRYPTVRYVGAIVGPPMASGALVGAAVWICRVTWLPGITPFEIAVAVVLSSVLFLLVAGRYCLFGEHQAWIVEVVGRKSRFSERLIRRWFGVQRPGTGGS
jgi:O-antigen/teichoic acid export membrane protein